MALGEVVEDRRLRGRRTRRKWASPAVAIYDDARPVRFPQSAVQVHVRLNRSGIRGVRSYASVTSPVFVVLLNDD